MHKRQPLTRRIRFALAGLREAYRGEASFRTQCAASVLVGLVLLWTRPAPIWWAALTLCCALVLAAELVNTALERALDALHPHDHPGIRAAKDCAAAAVLVLAAGAGLVFAAFFVSQ